MKSLGNNEINRYRKTIEKDGMTKTMTVEQVENGFIISFTKYGKESENEEYIDETKKYISNKNPLEQKKENESIDNIDETNISLLLNNFE